MKVNRPIYLFYFFLVSFTFGFFPELKAQQNQLDSLESVLKFEKKDSVRAQLYLKIASVAKDSATKFSNVAQAMEICEKNNFKKMEGRAYEIKARYYYKNSRFAAAVENWLLCLNESEQSGDNSMQANAYFHLGNIFKDFGNAPVALSYYVKSKTLCQLLNDTSFLEINLESLGALYNDLTNKQDSAKYYFDKAIQLSIRIHKNPSLEYVNMAEWFTDNNQYENALRMYHLADSCYALRNPENAEYGHVWVKMGIGKLFFKQGKFQDALQNLKITYAYAKANTDGELLENILFPIYETENKLGHTPEALKYLQEYVAFNDSVKGENNTRQIMLAQSQFEIQQKEKLNQLEKEKEEAQHNSELNRQRLILYGTIGVLSIVLIILFFIFRSYRVNKKAKEMIAMQKHIVDEKQKEILDSIHYAKRIQQSLMPTEKYIDKQLKKFSGDNGRET